MKRAEITPIGIVRSEAKDREFMTTFGLPAVVDVFPEYAEGLRHLEKHSHLWVLAWLHEADRTRLLVTPRGVTDRSEAGLHGVFAVRSPTRPNPIAMTAARIVRIEGTRIHLDRLDFIDGTPVIDLKPYFRSRDAIYAARNIQIGRPANRQALLESLLYQAENFHGERCGGLALGARLVEHLRSQFFDYAELDTCRARVPASSGCLIDSVMMLVRVTPGRATLQFHEENTVLFLTPQGNYEYRLHEPGRRWSDWNDLPFDDVVSAEEATLFSVTVGRPSSTG
ncbi:MAG TPA: tRNA (N6-threonylcarbamoyladenosine(37)-N6)-methyltransferase TrmO [Blastocatellia bacterium]|nr:tRNA (N6-threonylcarbamoyladenosine(37)-N6)-methyltransferase TrmO [Blastocatellia bacterium]